MKKGMDIIIHETAIIKIGDAVVMGDHIAIDPFFYMTTMADFGNWIHIGSHVSVIGGNDAILRIGDYVAISTGCRLVCRSNDFNFKNSAIPFLAGSRLYGNFIDIRDKVILGANSVILPDVTINEGAVVGANSLVKTDLDAWGIYAGIPAVKIGERHD
jgi:galactoside O-acetyltransferase